MEFTINILGKSPDEETLMDLIKALEMIAPYFVDNVAVWSSTEDHILPGHIIIKIPPTTYESVQTKLHEVFQSLADLVTS